MLINDSSVDFILIHIFSFYFNNFNFKNNFDLRFHFSAGCSEADEGSVKILISIIYLVSDVTQTGLDCILIYGNLNLICMNYVCR